MMEVYTPNGETLSGTCSMAIAVRLSNNKEHPMTDEAVQTNGTDFVELAADIVSAYVSNNSVPTGELPRIDQRSSFSA